MIETSPTRLLALVVGIDHYSYGDEWQLAGPAEDALRFVDWLLGKGVPDKNIALFLSEKSWIANANVRKWAEKTPWPRSDTANRDRIVQFVDITLPELDGDALIIFWGGHGAVDNHYLCNYLYTQDAGQNRSYCICTQTLMRSLGGPRFRHLACQIVIIDACATLYADTRERTRPAEARFVQDPIRDTNIKQCVMYAASPGKSAVNLSDRRSGLLSKHIQEKLLADESAGWPDFHAIFSDIVDQIEDETLEEQMPFLVLDWPGKRRRMLYLKEGESAIVQSLSTLISDLIKNEKIDPRAVYRHYVRALADPTRALDRAAFAGCLRHLADTAPRSPAHQPPLFEFAARVARETRDGQLEEWIADNSSKNAPGALKCLLDEEQRHGRACATLFVEIDTDFTRQIRWWLHTPDPEECRSNDPIAIGPGLLAEQIGQHLRGILADAEDILGDKYSFLISLILPHELLTSNIESTFVLFDDGGLETAPIPLNLRYPVLLHWHLRAKPPAGRKLRPHNAWKHALGTLAPRFEAPGGTEVVWLEPALPDTPPDRFVAAAKNLLDPHGAGICLGLGADQREAGSKMADDDIRGCLREGVPCFFWLANAPSDPHAARRSLERLFAGERPSEAPRAIAQKRLLAGAGTPLASIAIVWDAPGYLPSAHHFENPGP